MKKSFMCFGLILSMTTAFGALADEVEPTDIADALNFAPASQSAVKSIENLPAAAAHPISMEGPQQELGTTVAKSMKVAVVPEQFDCPLFSNSPYTDILTALDSLQSAINLFPTCQRDAQGQQLSQMGQALRDKILSSKKASDNGGASGVSQMENILSQAASFQEILTNTLNVPACYKDNSRQLIFSINETIQSLTPMALEFVTKNPALTSSFLPALAGVKAISQGLSTLEKVLSETATLDMSNELNRMAVIKNTCQFMKVYNRIEYLTLGRAERLKKINADFTAQLQPLLKKQSKLVEAVQQNPAVQSDSDKIVFEVKDRLQKNLRRIESALTEIAASPEARSQCSVIRTLVRMNPGEALLKDLELLAPQMALEDVVEFKRNKLQDLDGDAKTLQASNLSECVGLGQEWISSIKDLGQEILKITIGFEKKNNRSMTLLAVQKDLGEVKTKAHNLQENRRKMEKFTELSAFEPGEIAKRLRGMPRLLFNGTNGNLVQRLLKNGPVYDFLQDNEKAFREAKNDFAHAVSVLIDFEAQGQSAIYNNQQGVIAHYEAVKNYSRHFPRLTKEQLLATDSYGLICAAATKAIKSYMEATDYIGANQYFCQMIEPALKETAVSGKLKSYCQSAANKGPKAGYLLSIKSLISSGYKDQVENILERYSQLECN